MKTKRKTRVTKEEVRKIIAENKITSYAHKKKIIPGPWSNLATTLRVEVKLKKNDTGAIAEMFGPVWGSYLDTTNWYEKGWYPIVFNLEIPDLPNLIKLHGLDQVIAASEQSLNNLEVAGKLKYGLVVITRVIDHSDRGYIACYAKTNKKSISGFRAVRKNEFTTL